MNVRQLFNQLGVLDGAMSTSLERLGFNTNSELWSAKALIEAPKLVYTTHAEYLAAGANLVMTNTYQANVAAFEKCGVSATAAKKAITNAVLLAKKAVKACGHKAFVAAVMGPYGAYLADGSEYRGDYSLTKTAVQAFHKPRLEAIMAGNPDCLGLETQPQLFEVLAELDYLAAHYPNVPVYVSFVLDASKNIPTLPDGTLLATAAKAAANYENVVAIGINCIPAHAVTAALTRMHAITTKPLLVYPNLGATYDPSKKAWSKMQETVDFSELVPQWVAAGANVIGGCCTTTPTHIAQIAAQIAALK